MMQFINKQSQLPLKFLAPVMGWEQVCPRDNNENSEEVQFLTEIIFMGNI